MLRSTDVCFHQHSFSDMSSVFSHLHTSKRDQLCSYCLCQSRTLWLYLGIKTLLCQRLQIKSEKSAFACVWAAHGALQEHSFCSAFCWWSPARCGKSLRPQRAPCALTVWPHIYAFHIQELLPNLFKLRAPGAEMSLPPHTSSEITFVDTRETLDAKAFWTDKEINQVVAPSTLKLQMEQKYKMKP